MRSLVVEDDFTSRNMLHRILLKYGDCDVAANGREALKAIKQARKAGAPYEMICLDILMPGMNGHEVLRELRKEEAEEGIHGLDGVKVIITSMLDNSKTIMQAFREQCEGYLVKPFDVNKLGDLVRDLGLLK
jgi:two-component system chemotaxis response regulator CheY